MKLKNGIIIFFTLVLFICTLFVIMGFYVNAQSNSSTAEREERLDAARKTEEEQIAARVEQEEDIERRLKSGDFSGTNYKIVFLTFNDGPGEYSNEVLDILKENHVKATFFVNGQKNDFGDGIYRRISYEGHALGNHTFDHDFKEEDIIAEIEMLEDYLKMVIEDDPPRIFRFPNGSDSVSQHTIDTVKQMNYSYFDSNITVENMTSKSAEQQVLKEIESEEVPVVEFDIEDSQKSLPYLDDLIKTLKEEGYEFMVLKPEYNIVK